MIQSPNDGGFHERRRLAERRRLEERRYLGERRRMKHRRQGDAWSPAPANFVSAIERSLSRKDRDETSQMRQQSEERVRIEALLDLCEAMSPEATQQILHELRVHQLTLETQNEQLRRENEALETARSGYSDLYELASLGFCTLDAHNLIREANPATGRLLGTPPNTLEGLSISKFIHPADQPLYYRLLRGDQGDAAPPACELRMVKADGTIFWVQMEAAITQGPSCHLLLSDITARRGMEAENRQLQKAECLTRMARAIAHLFNNQLQMITSSLELIGVLPPGADPSKYLTMGRKGCERAGEVSKLLLLYLGQVSAPRKAISLAEPFRNCLDLLHGTLPGTVRLEADCPAPAPVVLANWEHLQQALMNLATNAREALGDAPGSIRLVLKTCLAADIPETYRFPAGWKPQDPDYACLEVADTGCGIAEGDLEKLFDPFFTTKFTGRGLGLPVAFGIIQAHGGALTVESKQGEGSTFRAYLPIWHETEP